jgi:hypothetical protein
MKPTEEECDQSDLRLANYTENSHQTLLLKMFDGHVRPWTGYVWPRQIYPKKHVICPVYPETSQDSYLSFQHWFLSYETLNWMKLGHKDHLNIKNTSPKEVFSKFKDFPFDFGLTQKPKLWRWTHEIFKSNVLKPLDCLKIYDTC